MCISLQMNNLDIKKKTEFEEFISQAWVGDAPRFSEEITDTITVRAFHTPYDQIEVLVQIEPFNDKPEDKLSEISDEFATLAARLRGRIWSTVGSSMKIQFKRKYYNESIQRVIYGAKFSMRDNIRNSVN